MKATHYGQDPQVEEKRLKELRSYDILDSLNEKDYEDITTLASVICDVPIVLISLVDKDRQWFKSHYGLDADETHRQHSFCSHAITNPGQAFIIPDSRLDDRFKNNPLVTGNPNVIFYAGIPLVSNSGYGLGTFCIIDNKPRELTEAQLNALNILAGQVMNMFELRKTNNTLNLKSELLERKTKNLDNIIAQRIAEVEGQRIELEKANKELQAFNYISSHDLQEPLRKIQTFASLINDREYNNLSEAGREYFLKIGKASSRMSHLLKDLLAYSRTTEKKQYDTISLKAIVHDIIEELEDETGALNASIIVNNDAHFNVIEFQFRQVICNLLSNSLKFSRPGIRAEITIDYKLTKRIEYSQNTNLEKDYHLITFKDNGIGFDSRYKEKIFQLFQRLETRDLQPGTGIGLAIVMKIIENHKGYITAESKPNEGTMFKIYIPV